MLDFLRWTVLHLLRGRPEGLQGQPEAGGERYQQPEAGQEDQGIYTSQ
jgi:hypothetical protein